MLDRVRVPIEKGFALTLGGYDQCTGTWVASDVLPLT